MTVLLPLVTRMDSPHALAVLRACLLLLSVPQMLWAATPFWGLCTCFVLCLEPPPHQPPIVHLAPLDYPCSLQPAQHCLRGSLRMHRSPRYALQRGTPCCFKDPSHSSSFCIHLCGFLFEDQVSPRPDFMPLRGKGPCLFYLPKQPVPGLQPLPGSQQIPSG